MPNEQVITIRQPATANLMIDSADRQQSDTNPFDFQISRPASIMNGFFSRIGTTEVVLEWCEPNITEQLSNEGYLNNKIVFDLSGTGANAFAGTETIDLSGGFYTVAEVLDEIVLKLNDLSGTTGMTFTVFGAGGAVYLGATGGVWYLDPTDQENVGSLLSDQLGLGGMAVGVYKEDWQIVCPDLRPYRYIDFTSQQLTYNQDLKDSTTNSLVRDVLCRWYFANDVPDAFDTYGFPILMGYRPFVNRRLFNPPKQIRWTNNMPVGNLAFQVYGYVPGFGLTKLPIIAEDEQTGWLMTLQMSEN